MFHFDRDFVDKNGERLMLPIRVRSTLRILESQYMLRDVRRTGDYDFFIGDIPYDELDQNAMWEPFTAGRSIWGEPDQWAWFRQTVVIPDSYKGQDVWYQLNAHTTSDGAWHWGHPQAQLFVNGECVFGFDCNHRRFLLAKHAKGEEKFEIAIKAYSDLTYFSGPMTLSADLIVIRPDVYELYQSMIVPLKAAALMNSDSMERIEIVKALNHAVTLIDTGADPDSEAFSSSVTEAHEYLKSHLYASLHSGAEPMLWAIGHTHIDVAWQWTYHVSRNKAARSFATNIRLLKENPDYLFMSSQPVLYEFV